jgi:hypothetical protein
MTYVINIYARKHSEEHANEKEIAEIDACRI